MEICIDFDGTCVTHEFPKIGKDIGAVPVLKKLVSEGHQLILFTMRSDITEVKSDDYGINKTPGNYLSDAVNWFLENGIPLYGINQNPSQKSWTKSPKAYGQLYIDDAALGAPLLFDKSISDRPFVDWNAAEIELERIGVLSKRIYEFLYNENLHESGYETLSIHKTRRGAEEAMELHKFEVKNKWEELRTSDLEDPDYWEEFKWDFNQGWQIRESIIKN